MSSTLLFDMSQLECVKEWLFTLRKHYSQHPDIWDLCRNWDTLKHTLLGDLNSGHYEFDPFKRIEIDEGVYFSLWSSRDMIALKLIARTLEQIMIDLPKTCLSRQR